MSEADWLFWQVVLAGAVRLATPVALAALGETLIERSGTINLAQDGFMTAGAFAAVVGASVAGWPSGLAAALFIGGLLGAVMAGCIVVGRANQIVIGIALSLIGFGLTSYLFQLWQPSGQSVPFVATVPIVRIPGLAEVPFVGDILFAQNPLAYLTIALLVAMTLFLRRTRLGLVVRAVGDDPAGAALRGIAVARVKTACLVVGGMLAGLGGAAITIGFLGSFTDGVTAGRGYVAIAVVIIGRWSPLGAVLGALLFAFFDSLGLHAQLRLSGVPSEAFAILPYAMTLLVLVATARSRAAPRALGAAMPR